MFAKLKDSKSGLDFIVRAVPAMILSFVFLTTAANAQTASISNGQTEDADKALRATTQTVKTPALVPVWNNYKMITIGMTADEVKDKLGKAEIADKDGFYYEFSADESAQIALDADQKVRAIIMMYKIKGGNVPKIEDVLGADPTVETNADGAVYKLVRYPEAGYWVAYNRTAGDNAMVTVTVQKL